MITAALLLGTILATTSASLATQRTCYFDGAWGDVCRYENICFKGSANTPLFITDDPDEFQAKTDNRIFATTKLFQNIDGLPNPKRAVPLHYKLDGRIQTISVADAERGGLGDDVVWANRTLWIPSYFEMLGNIWFYSTRVLPLFTANFYRGQWKLPPMEDVLLFAREDKVDHSW